MQSKIVKQYIVSSIGFIQTLWHNLMLFYCGLLSIGCYYYYFYYYDYGYDYDYYCFTTRAFPVQEKKLKKSRLEIKLNIFCLFTPIEWQWSTSRFIHKVSIQFQCNVSNRVTLLLTCIQSMPHNYAQQLLWFCDNICNTHESKLVS